MKKRLYEPLAAMDRERLRQQANLERWRAVGWWAFGALAGWFLLCLLMVL